MKTFLIQGLLLLLALMMGAFLGTAAKRKTERDSLLDRRVLETSVKDGEYGHWAAWRAMELLGASAPLPRVFELMPPRDEGVSLLDLKTLLEKAGLQVDARQETMNDTVQVVFTKQHEKTFTIHRAMSDPQDLLSPPSRKSPFSSLTCFP